MLTLVWILLIKPYGNIHFAYHKEIYLRILEMAYIFHQFWVRVPMLKTPLAFEETSFTGGNRLFIGSIIYTKSLFRRFSWSSSFGTTTIGLAQGETLLTITQPFLEFLTLSVPIWHVLKEEYGFLSDWQTISSIYFHFNQRSFSDIT